jgi:diguanylate cyclase (GGDEF)-like protein
MKRLLALLLVLCGAAPVAGAAAVRGFPLITVYPAEEHKAGPQNFEIAQDARGVLYFGNLAGLLTWDGAWWRLLTLPDEQAPLSVASNAKGTVMLGMVDDLGTVAADATGSAKFRSLVPFIPKEAREFGEVNAICVAGDAFLFVAEKRLFSWDGRTMRVAEKPATAPRACFSDAGGTFLYGRAGLQRFDIQAMRADAPLFAGKRVDLVLRAANGHLVTAIRDEGLFAIDGPAVTPYATEIAAQLKGAIVSAGTRLHDGRLAIGTRQHGLGILDRDGRLEEWINDKSGLPDAVLAAAFTDREGALWLGMEGPIVRIDVATPVSLFDARRGLKGSLSDVVQFGGRIWATTSHGVFVFDEAGVAHAVEGITGSAWHLLPFDDQLLIATSKGVFRTRDGKSVEQLVTTDVEVYDMDRSPADPSRVWLAVRTGVQSIRFDGTRWIEEPRVAASPEYITTIIEDRGVLFCGTVFDGVVRIDDPRGKPRMTQYGTGEMNVYSGAGRVLFVSASGEIVAPGPNGSLVPDPQLGHVRAPRGFFVIAEDARGNIWLNSTPPRVVQKLSDGRYARETQPLVAVTAADIQALRTSPDGGLWFGSDKGLFRYEPSAATAVVAQPAPLIRRVVAGDDRMLYGGDGIANADVTLRHDHRRIRIEFAPASYRPGVMYQYRLDPSDAGWSAWTGQPFIDYTNLDAADYVFRLRSRGPDATPSREAVWTFAVSPPWYRTAWAYVLWTLLAIALVAAIILLRTRALRRQAEQLRVRVAEQTEELRHKNQLLERLSLLDELTNIANRRFFEKALADEWNRALRREEPLSLILLDLDHFKELNDRRGHRAGDDCLRVIGRFLGETIRRSGEVVARYGGEEFAVLLPGTDTLDAVRVAERLRQGIEKLEIGYTDGVHWRVTTSCGVATMLPRLGDAMESLVDRADRALYAAKHAGRNVVRVTSEEPSATWLKDAESL